VLKTRFFQALLVVSTIAFSWLAMQACHEAGHVLHAWLSGGKVTAVVLDPRTISRTDVSPNPRPLFVAWGGAIWGSILPLAVRLVTRKVVPRYAYLAAWIAGFCLIANGAYLGPGSFLAHGGGDDPSEILAHGGARWQLLVFGFPSIAAGLFMWNGLGVHFGLGTARGEVDRRVAVGMAVAAAIVAVTELASQY
jgi:hypothetical protein